MKITKVNKHTHFVLVRDTEYDVVAELAVSSYNLDVKNRKEDVVDMKHCFIRWWSENKEKFNTYKTMTGISSLLKVHHTTVNHLEKHRKESLRYKENIECINDFLTS